MNNIGSVQWFMDNAWARELIIAIGTLHPANRVLLTVIFFGVLVSGGWYLIKKAL